MASFLFYDSVIIYNEKDIHDILKKQCNDISEEMGI